MFPLYVRGLPGEITLDDLIIYFQSTGKSGGGDVDYDACELDGDKAVIVFEKKEYLDNVLKKIHEIDGYKLEISAEDKPKKPTPKPRTKKTESKPTDYQEFQKRKYLPNQPDVEKARLGEVRTVIVSGLCPDSTNETVKMLFESSRRSCGGEIENLERLEPGVAHITFASAEVAAQVLKQDKLELDGYLLQLKEKQPELFLPLDRRKLYVENINPTTSEDSLWNYMEVRTKLDVTGIQRGDYGNAFITFNEEPDMKKVLDSKKPLEGAELTISNPPVCNSILVTGLSKKTTKQAIEMYFENERNGGGKIYGDIIYQKDKGRAVVSYCDPINVVRTLSAKEHRLNQSVLTLRQHYPFMETITETSTRMIKIDTHVLDHVLKNCEKEIFDRFGDKALEILKGETEEFTFPSDTANEIEAYLAGFTVEKIPIGRRLLESFRNELEDMIRKANQGNITVKTDKNKQKIEIAGEKGQVTEVQNQFQLAMAEMEKQLNIVTKMIPDVAKTKFELLSLHGAIEMLGKIFYVEVGFGPRRDTITLKGTGKHVSTATEELLKKCSQITEDNVDLSKNERLFLQNGGLDIVNKGMKAIRLRGMVSLSQKKSNNVKIHVFDGAKSEDVEDYLRRCMYERQYSLDEDSRTLLNSEKWKAFYKSVMTGTSVMIFTDKSPPEISLIGEKLEVEQVFDSLKEFMKRNTIVKESIGLGVGYKEYLQLYCKKELEAIGNNFEEHYVKVYFGEEDKRLIVCGTKEGVKNATRQLDKVVSTIATGTVCVDKQRDQKFFKSEEGKDFIEVVQSKSKCLVRLTEKNESESTMISSTKSPPAEPTSKLLCSHETREKILLKVYKDNITAHPCDVIVNAANGDLKHIGGVAKSILDAGGREIQDECDEHVKENGKLFDGQCFSGSPGKLPCKVLVHAVGPRWDASNREKICKLLSVTCTRALEEAIKYRSIALPAIGSGVYGIPKDVCAEIMIEAAEKFSRNHEDSSVKEIHFVNNDDASGHVFVKKFREKFGGRPSLIRNEEKPANSRFYASLKPSSQSVTKETARKAVSIQDDLQKRKSDDSIFTTQNMKISVVVGDLATYKADVLVNTTGHTLDLEANPCSKALSYEAGPTLQSECRRIGKLNVGQVAVTTGGNLLCDEVFHVVCDKWRRGQGEEVLRVIIKKCLKKCNSNGKKSIAFPAIGTGVLGFPHDVAAKIFFEETKDFEKRVPNSSIEEVSFVVYSRDSESIKAFKKEIKRQSEWGSGVSVGKVSDGQQKRWKRNPVGVGVEKGDLCVEIGNGKKVEIVKGDITKERSDVIAHLTNPSLFMRSGVAIALVKAGGNDIERASQNIGSSYKLLNATTVLTTAGRLDAKYVAHMVASNDPSFSEIEKCITNCLNRVTEKKCESISFPAVGTGSLKNDPGKAAKTIFSSVVRFLQSSTGSLKTVRIVLKDDDLVEAFQASVKKFNESKEPGVFKKIVNYFWSTESPAALKVVENTPVTTTELLLEIYAQNEATVGIAKEKILNVIEKQKKKEKLDDENIVKLSSMQVEEIKRWCDVNDVKVTIDKELNRIIMFGHSEDISTMITKIYQVLKKIGERERAEMHAEYAEMVSKSVQWFYVDPATGDHEEYHKHTNAAIEKAYSKNEKSVIFDLIDGKCKIVFDRMQEMNLDTNVKTEVMRKDLKEISVPDYWEPQPLDANGKELVVHLVLLNPKNPNHKKECMEISDHFNRTCGQQILQIERIQNPSLYKQYVTKKLSLDQKGGKGSNEAFLFHGTSPDKLEEITEKGLNRSYAGNTHGVAFGRGVYFARDASMSAGYAQPDISTGRRYMYYTRVAVGEYTNGGKGIVVPPNKGWGSNDSYDSVVNDVNNPTIYVLFYDNQYYPEYLITFQ